MVHAAEGGIAPSDDGNFSVALQAGMYDVDVTIKVTQGITSPAPIATAGSVYRVEVSPATAVPSVSFQAALTFRLTAAQMSALHGVMSVAYRDGTTGDFDGYLGGSYDSTANEFHATTTHFTDFAVVDSTMIESCTCNTDAGCQSECSFCDPDCTQPGDPLPGDPLPGDPISGDPISGDPIYGDPTPTDACCGPSDYDWGDSVCVGCGD